ncbi:MAG: integrase catalytic domain-containing protein [Candidatus Methylomirabilales bacterium]
MTRASLREYAALQRARYLRAPRAEKHALLNEVVAVTGLHRKGAIRLLRRPPRPPTSRPRSGRPRVYGSAVAAAAQLLSEATGHIGPQRWHPFLPELLDRLTQSGDLLVPPDLDKQLRQVSPATLARLLAPFRTTLPPRGLTTTRPGAWLKHQIPVRTFAEWTDAQPGFLELDLVAHCGPTTRGFYLCTLCAVDVATTWVDLQAVWGKGQQRVGTAIHHVRQRLPMPLRGLDSDNGSEFINHDLYAWCQREGITFTRSRPYQKNDSAHVEQKNGAIVRPLIGYDRYASKAAYAQLARVYDLARLHINFFQPVQKLVTKERRGARVHRVYGRAQTPYQRLCATDVLPALRRQELEALYQRLNPLHLRRQLEVALERLWPLAVPPGPSPAPPRENAPAEG